MNDFVFQRQLDQKLFALLQKHSEDKPILVFCSTRKGTMDAAELLCQEYEKCKREGRKPPWSTPQRYDD
jgi:ATP-dependent DNA helicase HFM1/MER3